MNVGSVYYPELAITHVNFNEGDSDHTSFNNHGYMGIYPFEDSQNYSPYIHTPNDVIGTSVTSFEMSQQYCQMNIACLAEIAHPVTDGVKEVDNQQFMVYPNPAESQLNVNAEGLQKVMVYNMAGQLVETIEMGQDHCAISVAAYPAGIYTVQMVTAKGVFNRNFVVRYNVP